MILGQSTLLVVQALCLGPGAACAFETLTPVMSNVQHTAQNTSMKQ